MRTGILLPLILLASVGVAYAAPVETVKTDKGNVLAGKNGMTLYTFKNDTKGVSNCNDACAALWPPYMAEKDAKAEGAYTPIKRKDGSMQWAKDGMPLYYWSKDTKKGDMTGDGFKGVWNAAKP